MAAISGVVAWAFYARDGLSEEMDYMYKKTIELLPSELFEIMQAFDAMVWIVREAKEIK